jgi:maleylacetate reductase
MDRLARALNANHAAQGIFDLVTKLGAPTSLESLGVALHDLDRVADEAMRSPYPNPRKIDRDAIRALLEDAYFGRSPSNGSFAE